MMPQPAFSVIIPVYNNRETLVRAIESVQAQTFPLHEIIVIDDGSTDNSAGLVQNLFGSGIQVLSFAENRGPAAARNAGIEVATGTHIAFLDADDFWHKDKLKRMAAVLGAYPEALLVYHSYALTPTEPENAPVKRVSLWPFLLHNPVATPCAVVRKSPIRFNEDLHWMEDYDYFLRHAETGPVYFLPQKLSVLGRPVLSPGGQSSRRWQMRKSEGKVIGLFARRHPLLYPLLPFFMALVLAKHVYQEAKRLA